MDLSKLTTEQRNPNTTNIDSESTSNIVNLINQDDQIVAMAVAKQNDKIAKAIDLASERFIHGGRLIYCGAGTSGRIGLLDAAEMPTTYGVKKNQVIGLIAGGLEAMYESSEGTEDQSQLAVNDLKILKIKKTDVIISISASGRTPYAIGALEYANEMGALTISLSCVEHSEMSKKADVAIEVVVGPEVITGSTRMKAGTAEKMVLNMLSTGVMIRNGKVYKNLMVDVQVANDKLYNRAIHIISEVTNKDLSTSKEYFLAAHKSVKIAIVMIKTGLNDSQSEILLNKHNGRISSALRDARNNEKTK